jgi:NTE family protein
MSREGETVVSRALSPGARDGNRDDSRGEHPRTAFVLSGGGNQGVAQVGMLRGLVERGIVPDVVIGTSVGALNGAALCYAPNLTGIARLANVWMGLTTASVFPGSKISRAWNVMRRETNLFSNEGLVHVIDEATPARSFADLQVPLRVIATDLDTGEEVVIARGPLKPALLASTCLPGIFPVIEHGGRRLVDGGVVNSVPLWHAISGPVDRVYVLNVSGSFSDRQQRSPLDVVMTSFAHARNQRYELERRFIPPGVELIELPRPHDTREIFDFSGGEDLIEGAYQLTIAALDARARVARAAAPAHRRPHLPFRRARTVEA